MVVATYAFQALRGLFVLLLFIQITHRIVHWREFYAERFASPSIKHVQRVAVCLTGDARTFRCPLIHNSIRTNLIQGLSSAGASVRLFTVLNFSASEASKVHEALATIEPVSHLTANSVSNSNMQACASLPDERDESWRNTFKGQFEKVQLCYDMVQQDELTTGYAFNFIIRARPDHLWTRKLAAIHNARTDVVTIGHIYSNPVAVHLVSKLPNHSGYCSIHDVKLCVPNDHFAIIPRKFAEKYMNSVREYKNCGKPEDYLHCHEDPWLNFEKKVYAPPECILSRYLWREGVPLNFGDSERLSIFFDLTKLSPTETITINGGTKTIQPFCDI